MIHKNLSSISSFLPIKQRERRQNKKPKRSAIKRWTECDTDGSSKKCLLPVWSTRKSPQRGWIVAIIASANFFLSFLSAFNLEKLFSSRYAEFSFSLSFHYYFAWSSFALLLALPSFSFLLTTKQLIFFDKHVRCWSFNSPRLCDSLQLATHSVRSCRSDDVVIKNGHFLPTALRSLLLLLTHIHFWVTLWCVKVPDLSEANKHSK
jgi:hypothetical protein